MIQTGDLYYQRMGNSVGDKSRMFPYVIGDNIVDVGGGDGSLLAALQDSYQYKEVTNLDASLSSSHRSWEKGIPCVKGYADDLEKHFLPGSVDTLIASSVLHEIFSYGNPEKGQQIGKIDNVRSFLSSASMILPSKGRLIIRDGVSPGYSKGILHMEKDNHWVEKFLHWSPFTQDSTDRHISIRRESVDTFSGSLSSLMEFLFTYTWGPESFAREVQEFYGVFTLEQLELLAAEYGFICTHKESYLQPGYVENLSHITLEPYFPHSNALWVLEKE